jgi:hypothetical protein
VDFLFKKKVAIRKIKVTKKKVGREKEEVAKKKKKKEAVQQPLTRPRQPKATKR